MDPIKIAIVEDEPEDQDALAFCLDRYMEEQGVVLEKTIFSSGDQFLKSSRHFDLVFMDIEMPGHNGIETAQELRNRGFEGTLVLVTNMIQYAIHGYAVHAVDYIVKPVLYEQLALKLPSYLSLMRHSQTSITIKNKDGVFRIKIQTIRYIEIYSHSILIHLTDSVKECYGTLREFEKELADCGFVRSSQSCLVNLSYVTGITHDSVQLGEESVALSRREKKAFLSAFTKYDGGYGL